MLTLFCPQLGSKLPPLPPWFWEFSCLFLGAMGVLLTGGLGEQEIVGKK